MSGRREVEDCEPSTRKHNTRRMICPQPAIVRSAMPQGTVHRVAPLSHDLL